MKYIVFDTETTGLDKPRAPRNSPCSITDNGDEIIQIGGLMLDEHLEPVKAFCHYCDCLRSESSANAFRAHCIRLEDIRMRLPCIFFEEVLLDHLPEFLESDVTFVGYNSDFDVGMVTQSLRSTGLDFGPCKPIVSRLMKRGRYTLDALAFLPQKVKLVSLHGQLTPAREQFYRDFQGKLPVESNAMDLFRESWNHAHNALFDSIETYLLLKTEVIGKKLFVGRR